MDERKTNLERLQTIADGFEELNEKVVYVGGSVGYWLVAALLAAIFPLSMSAQSEKVVIEKQTGNVYRYLGESKSQYHAETQDDFWIPKSKAVVKIYSAANGQGVVFPNDFGTVNVREKPDKKSKIVSRLVYEEGMLPDTADCLGKVEGWYKVKTYKGKIGYIRGDLIEWTAVCTF